MVLGEAYEVCRQTSQLGISEWRVRPLVEDPCVSVDAVRSVFVK
jgi:hypothetical protein